MMNLRGSALVAALVAIALVSVMGSAEAGVVYTDETAFNTAVAGLGSISAWSENFEGFAVGAVADPLLLGGGMAEVVDGGTASIGFGATGQNWVQADGSPASAVVRGPGNTGLGLQAISFNFGNQAPQTVTFVGTGGSDTSAPFASDPTGTSFVGWIATGPETVLTAQFDQTGGITLDNLDGFVAHAPEPGTFLLFGLGAAGLFFANRRRKNRKTA